MLHLFLQNDKGKHKEWMKEKKRNTEIEREKLWKAWLHENKNQDIKFKKGKLQPFEFGLLS